jgi:hypothetical protein
MNRRLMNKLFPRELALVDKGNCPFCGKKVNPEDFRDGASVKEFGISGLCQKCQDEVFR